MHYFSPFSVKIYTYIRFLGYLSIYNEYSAKLQKAISGRGKIIMVPYEDKQEKTT